MMHTFKLNINGQITGKVTVLPITNTNHQKERKINFKNNVLSQSPDLAKLNPKCHFNYL